MCPREVRTGTKYPFYRVEVYRAREKAFKSGIRSGYEGNQMVDIQSVATERSMDVLAHWSTATNDAFGRSMMFDSEFLPEHRFHRVRQWRMSDIVQQCCDTCQPAVRWVELAFRGIHPSDSHDAEAVLIPRIPGRSWLSVGPWYATIVDCTEEADFLQSLECGGCFQVKQQWVIAEELPNVPRLTKTGARIGRVQIEGCCSVHSHAKRCH